MAPPDDPKVTRLEAAFATLNKALAECYAALDDLDPAVADASLPLRMPQGLEMFARRVREILGDDVDDETGWHGGGSDDDEG